MIQLPTVARLTTDNVLMINGFPISKGNFGAEAFASIMTAFCATGIAGAA